MVKSQPMLDFIEVRNCNIDWQYDTLRHALEAAKVNGSVDYFNADAILTHLGYPGAARALYPDV
jgi:hypothetical protein